MLILAVDTDDISPSKPSTGKTTTGLLDCEGNPWTFYSTCSCLVSYFLTVVFFFIYLTVREKQYLFQYKEKYSIHLSIHQYSATYPGSRNHPNQMPEQSQLDPFNTASFTTLV